MLTVPLNNVRSLLAGILLSSVFLASCESQVKQMDVAELTDFATRYAAAWSNQDPAAFASFYAEDGVLLLEDAQR